MIQHNFNAIKIKIDEDFDSIKLNEYLDKFSNKLVNSYIVTYYDNKEICRAEISNVYYNFDFTTFTKSIISEIQNYFIPEKQILNITSGFQEIRLIGDNILIDNENYKKIITIVNSTDKSKSLSMNIGLVKMNSKNKPISYTILTSFSNKHYKSSLPDKIKSFSDNLINFNINIDFHIKTIDDMKNKNISIIDFCKKMMFDNNNKLIKSVDMKIRALGKSLIHKHNMYDNYLTLCNLSSYNINTTNDFEINTKILYNTYIELFSNQDTSIIARESRRIIDALDRI